MTLKSDTHGIRNEQAAWFHNAPLENNFNAKVADFGLAKHAPEGRGNHLSTCVMGTFGYVAREYAMTGHLLVKSDVYSGPSRVAFW